MTHWFYRIRVYNYINGAASGILRLPSNFAIRGKGKYSSYIIYDANAFYFTNNDVFKSFSVISTNLWMPIPDKSVAAFYSQGNASNCVWDDVGITTWANGIASSGSASFAEQWIVNNCDLFCGQRAEYWPGTGSGSWSSNRFSRIYVQENTNQASVTIVGLSLSGDAAQAPTNYIDNCTITVDGGGATNHVEYIGIYAANAYTHIGNTPKRAINTNNVSVLSGGIVELVLFEGSLGMDFDETTPSSEVCYNGLALQGLPTWPRGDAGKLGINELVISKEPGITISSNLFVDVPNWTSGIIFDSAANPITMAFLTNHFFGLVPNQGMSFDFSGLAPGLTNNVNFTNVNGISVTFWAPNRLWVTNLSGGTRILMCSKANEDLVVSNVGNTPITGFFGSFQQVTNIGNPAYNGLPMVLTVLGTPSTNNFFTSITNVYNQACGGWNGFWTNITTISAFKFGPGAKNSALTNFLCFNAVPLTRQKVFAVSYTGQTNPPTTDQLPQSGMFTLWMSNAPSTNIYIGVNWNGIISNLHASLQP